MTSDLAAHLRRYFAVVDESQAAIDFAEVAERGSSVQVTNLLEPAIRRPAFIAGLAGLVTVVAFGAVLLTVRPFGGDDTIDRTDPAVVTSPDGTGFDLSGTGADVATEPTVTSVPVPSTVASVPVPSTTAPVGETGPRWVETKLSPSDVSTDAEGHDGNWYGLSVAVDGDRIVIGSPTKYEGGTYAGAVYVYEPDGDGGWSETKLVASDGATLAGQFGMSVAVDGDIVVVGRPFELDPDGGPPETTGSQGAVYVYEPDGDGGWSETKLTASDPADLDQFGSSVAVSGDRIVVGAGGDGPRHSGAVYVFERDGQDGWLETKLTASDQAERECFGYFASYECGVPVVVEGDLIATGSRSAVYLFEPDGNGGWAETRLAVSAYWVAIDGDRLVIGSESGVHTYGRDATGAWNATDLATTPQGFGNWLDASDDRIAVTVDTLDSGLAYVVERNDEGDWVETVLKSDTNPGNRVLDPFGWSDDGWVVALDGDRVVVGAPYASGNGVAYVYEWSSE